MNSVEFENDISIIIKAHNLTIKRSKKEIKLILIYHITYEVIEIKVYENNSNKFLGREILIYSDIFQIFNNYFICFNENMQKIFEFFNNCICLKKYEIYINEVAKAINLELYILKENNMDAKSICITSCEDEEKWKLVSQKIKELNGMFNEQKKNIVVAPFLNCIKFENNIHCLYMDIYIEKEIEILVFKTIIINKNNSIINNSNKKEEIFAGFYSRDDINNMSKYYESISNINEISDDIKINLSNKNLKIENITEEKIRLSLKVLSSINPQIITFDLIKGLDIKDKYIQIIKELKLKNEFLVNNDVFIYRNNLSREQKNKSKNNNVLNNIELMPINSIKNTFNDSNNEEKKLIGKKRKRLSSLKKIVKNNTKKDKKKEEKSIDDNSILSKNIKNDKKKEKEIDSLLLNMDNSNKKKSTKIEDKIRCNLQKKNEKKRNYTEHREEEYIVICDNKGGKK